MEYKIKDAVLRRENNGGGLLKRIFGSAARKINFRNKSYDNPTDHFPGALYLSYHLSKK